MRVFTLLLTVVFTFFASSCARQKYAKGRHVYQFEKGKTVKLVDGQAIAPRRAPRAVKRAVAAANNLTNKPYKYGGGHAKFNDWGYDCSGSTSYVLREAGLIKGCLTSGGFYKYGKKGAGDWITIYARKGHVFMTIGGLRFDTGGSNSGHGPRWKPQSRKVSGHVMRHPAGL